MMVSTKITSNHVACLLPSHNVPGALVNEDNLLFVGDNLWLGELIESSASLEDERVRLNKLLDTDLLVYMQYLEPK